MTLVHVLLCLLCVLSGTEANSAHLPRMIFTDKETRVQRLPLTGQNAPVQMLLQGPSDTVTAATLTNMNSYDFHKTPVESTVLWNCAYADSSEGCSYNLTVVLKMEANRMLMCGTNSIKEESLCCEADFSSPLASCSRTDKLKGIHDSIRLFHIKKGEPSAFDDKGDSADLYITHSGSRNYVIDGIYKFGKKSIKPYNDGKKKHYMGMILSKRRDNLQSRVYALYKEKNKDPNVFSGMWLPFVSQVCMSDLGGPKTFLQNTWTSHMKAKLFCGDVKTKQHFSEMVDVAIIHADSWQDTRVYGLFRNEWGMSALCVFTVRDIDLVFTTSLFKGLTTHPGRSRECPADSTVLPTDVLKLSVDHSEMELSVRPVNNAGPLFLNHHNYTHIYADSTQQDGKDPHTVIFLSLSNGRIHKVIQTENLTFFVAEYRPFTHQAHIHNIIFLPSSRRLYVYAGSELVQLDVENCAMYGDSCEQCVLARDPHCGWSGAHCSPWQTGMLQDVTTGNFNICPRKPNSEAVAGKNTITLPDKSRYFLQCPVVSHHALYSWHHQHNSTMCSSVVQDCVLLLDSMSPEKEGVYTCLSEESGYIKVQAQYHLQLEITAGGPSLRPLLWGCLMTALITCLSS
ncbi:semaphorin-7A-like [Solea senegalensis]|uniref:Semaphorin-7A-like n=1 Tax=Solea senegalensis TaxID=28829 RepID=A0AAV6Q7U2_SOLSE|nr:semaphorin-7A-like [Solea senegalensis]KAG7482979.1 semaphorin-7A-like [Solea senegalensis]